MGGRYNPPASSVVVSDTPVHRMHISRRSSGVHQAGALQYSGGESSGRLVGLGLEHSSSSEPSSSRRSSPSNSNSYSSSPSSGGGDFQWSSDFTQHERERGHMHQPTTSRSNTPVKNNSRAYSHKDIPWQPFGSSWTPEKANSPSLQMANIPSIATLRQDDISPFRLQPSPSNLCRSHSTPSHLDEYETQTLSASASRASTSYRNISPSPSLSSLSRLSLDPRRNAEIALSIAPSPPMTSSATFQQHLTSPNSLTNRTSPKAANGQIHRRDVSLTTACMPGSTSSDFFASARRRPSTDVINGDQCGSSAASTSVIPKQPSKIDKVSWSSGSVWNSRKRSPSDEGPSPELSASKRSLRTARQAGLVIAGACLGPFCGLIFPEPSRNAFKSLSKSNPSLSNRKTASNGHTRWPNIVFRTLLGIFLFYSLILFTSRMLVVPRSPPASTLKARSLMQTSLSEYSSWQQARFKLLDVYHVAADAIGSTASRMGRQTSKAAAGDFAGESNGANSLTNLMLLDRLPEVKRRWGETEHVRNPKMNPLTSFSTKYRFSKMFSKADSSLLEQIEPFVFRAQSSGRGGDITACLYFNDAWISQLPAFMERWQGPVSIVYELAEHKASPARTRLITRLQEMIERHPLLKDYADIHVVYNDPQSDLQARRLRERLVLRPVGSNLQLNLARFFAKTDMVWLVSDARVLPSPNLRQHLNELEDVRTFTMDYADAIIVPLFGSTRKHTFNATAAPLLSHIRESLGINLRQDGVSEVDFEKLGEAYVQSHLNSIPLDVKDWPSEKSTLVALSSSHPPPSLLPDHLSQESSALFALFDRRWEMGKGPTDFGKWKKTQSPSNNASRLASSDVQGAGFYQVTDYDLHYAPSLVIGRERQPWCTERFEYNRAACIYQMYLQGAKKWVLADGWAYTLETIDKHAEKEKKNEAEKMKSAIAARLYTKFFSEACMHYGRAFLSNDLWESERAQHLRYSCARVLHSYGIGLSEEEEAEAAAREAANKKKKKKKKK